MRLGVLVCRPADEDAPQLQLMWISHQLPTPALLVFLHLILIDGLAADSH